MPHFYVRTEDINASHFSIRGSEAHHIRQVLKKAKGDVIKLFDGKNRSYTAKIDSITPEGISGTLIDDVSETDQSRVRIHLFQGVPRGQKMDYIIGKCTELGVSSITPISCQRCVKKLDPHTYSLKYDRWKNISLSASKQCGRADLPRIHPVSSFSDAVQCSDGAVFQFLPWEGEERVSLKDALNKTVVPNMKSDRDISINIWIGPEGGFSFEEVTEARHRGIQTVTLGKRILRTETAGMVTVALIQYELDVL